MVIIETNKRGISPLIATVLLIAFAVSLGAVVMSWGDKVQENAHNTTRRCTTTFIDFFVLKNHRPDACIYNSTIQMTIESVKGRTDDIKVIIDGTKNVMSLNHLLKKSISEGDSARVKIRYDLKKYGKIKAIKVYPVIKNYEEYKPCLENFIILSNLTSCNEGNH